LGNGGGMFKLCINYTLDIRLIFVYN